MGSERIVRCLDEVEEQLEVLLREIGFVKGVASRRNSDFEWKRWV